MFDQSGSRWIAQAQHMNGRIGGSLIIKSDQFNSLNPIFIVILVPIFDSLVYPLLGKINVFKRTLQRMGVGLLFASVSFIIAAALEAHIQASTAARNPTNQLRVLNLAPCTLHLHDNNSHFLLEQGTDANFVSDNSNSNNNNNATSTSWNVQCATLSSSSSVLNVSASTPLPKTLLVYADEAAGAIKTLDYAYNVANPPVGESQVRFVLVGGKMRDEALSVEFLGGGAGAKVNRSLVQPIQENKDSSRRDHTTLDYGDYKFAVRASANESSLLEASLSVETCARYTIVLYPNANSNSSSKLNFAIVVEWQTSGVHLAWQLLQTLVISMGEIMFSISGLSFAYSQAPASMKSVLQASWFLTVAFGNLIDMLVAETRFIKSQVWEYVFFASLMLLSTCVFVVIAYFYKYVEDDEHDRHADDAASVDSDKRPIADAKSDDLHSF